MTTPPDDPEATVPRAAPAAQAATPSNEATLPADAAKTPLAPEDQATQPAPPHPPSGAARQASTMVLSKAIQDLAGEGLLVTVPRTDYHGVSVPALGGIPLLAKLGQGGMGAVYYGVKVLLEQEVAVKVLAIQSAEQRPDLVDRFLREARIAARVESPHLVRVTDVNEEHGLFYLVMEYVNGVSAGALLRDTVAAAKELDEATAVDICLAATTGLASAHAQGVVHRDIKPDNVLVPKAPDGSLLFAAAKLADLGLARDLARQQTLTGVQDSMGTPGYMAPEQATAVREAGKPADVFSMGAALYALLAGQSPFKGPSSTATILKTIQEPHVPIRQVRPGVSPVTAALLDRCLAKNPQQRYVDASALRDALRICRTHLRGEGTAEPEALERITLLQRAPEVGNAAQPLHAPEGEAPPARAPRRGRIAALAAVTALVLVCLAAALWPGGLQLASVKLGIAHGPEKDAWLAWAVEEFRKTPEGRGVTIELLPLPSQKGARAVLGGDQRIHVWWPTSSIYEELFRKQWAAKYGTAPIAKQEDIALTPMVFVNWKEGFEALREKYKTLNFMTASMALHEKDGWEGIAKRPDWGRFVFGLPDPEDSNCGLADLILMAHEFHKKEQVLALADVNNGEFLAWLHGVKASAARARDTSQMMRAMAVKGPGEFDMLCTYECLAIRYLKDMESRWEPLHIEYPARNLWNDNTYYVLNVPWGTLEQRRAAEAFMKFLLSVPAQTKALSFGFRPANPDVPMKFPESPFELYAKYGLKLDVPVTCNTPKAEVLEALLANWQKGAHQPPILLDEE